MRGLILTKWLGRPSKVETGMSGEIKKRSIVIDGHKTSVSLEAEFWQSLKQIAAKRGVRLNALVAEIDRARSGNLSSALRVFVLRETQALARGDVV